MARRARKRVDVRSLNEKTKKNAFNYGQPWSDDDVSALANMIAKDATTFDMAMTLGRTYYSLQTARAHVRFALSHYKVLRKWAE